MKPILAAIGSAIAEPDVIRTNLIAIGSVAASSVLSRIDVLVQVLILLSSLAYTLTKAATGIISTVRIARTAGEISPHAPRSAILPECTNIQQCPLLLAARKLKVMSRRHRPQHRVERAS